MNALPLSLSRRLRVSPFESRSLPSASRVSVYNHVVLPVGYHSLEEDYWHLREHVQIWDVACQVQVEIKGPDALRLVEWMTPRDVAACEPGQCIYAPLLDRNAGIVNDPIVLCHANDHYWLSLSDSDVLLWAKGIAESGAWDVEVADPGVFPLSVQGPKAEDLLARVLGESIRTLKFFRFVSSEIHGIPVKIARTGWSGQGGFEVYLMNPEQGEALWDLITEAGDGLALRPGAPNLIDRIETGLLSWGNDMTLENNPFEAGLDRFFKMGKQADYLAREALERIAEAGPSRKLVRLAAGGEPVDPPRDTWPVLRASGERIGEVTSMVWSPRLEQNVGFAYVPIDLSHPGAQVGFSAPGGLRSATVCGADWAA